MSRGLEILGVLPHTSNPIKSYKPKKTVKAVGVG